MTETHFDDETWRRLIESVFAPQPGEARLALLVDLPDDRCPDDDAWSDRRRLAAEWLPHMARALSPLGIEVEMWLYRNAHTNNGDLPAEVWRHSSLGGPIPAHVSELASQPSTAMRHLFEEVPMLIALSEFSATAPLKVAARRHGFRAATMPGFSRAMVPALGLDFSEVDRRCQLIKSLLDAASEAHFDFAVGEERHALTLDLRHRTAHASSGLLRTPGVAGNLPSGETYIVPYEGEIEADPSRSQGSLPVDFGGETVVYAIEGNRATNAAGHGPQAAEELERLRREPAYANLAELGLGVLGELGLEPVGEILLDEKLGLHIAFGRSDHFGGSVSPADFSSADAVVHIDRVYLPDTGSSVEVLEVTLSHPDGRRAALMRHGRYHLDFDVTAEEIWR